MLQSLEIIMHLITDEHWAPNWTQLYWWSPCSRRKEITCPKEGITLHREVGGGVALGRKIQKLQPEEWWVLCPGDSLRVGVLLLAIGLCFTRTLSCRLCRRRRETWSQVLSPWPQTAKPQPNSQAIRSSSRAFGPFDTCHVPTAYISAWHGGCAGVSA